LQMKVPPPKICHTVIWDVEYSNICIKYDTALYKFAA